jgi:4-amino-4-deoxy-L-arabinose transferase-like glycosyltransferase
VIAARLGLLFTLVLGAAVRWIDPSAIADLRPRPDALEYEEAARNLVHGEGYCLVLDGKKYVPRYPVGFSALLAPALLALGDEPGTGVRAVLVSALVAIAATWRLGLASGGGATAVVAALLLALLPLHVRWSKMVMSDVSASAAVALLAASTVVALGRGAAARTWLLLGAVSALAATIRPTDLLLLAPTAALLAGRRAWTALGALGAGVVSGLVPWWVYNAAYLGSPVASGYMLWVPGDYFSSRFAFEAPVGGGSEPNLVFYARALAGLETLYPWPIGVLALLGAGLALRRPGSARTIAVLALGFAASLFLVQAFFLWQWDRFFLPVVPLLLVLAAIPLGAGAPWVVRVAALGLAVTAVAGMLGSEERYAGPKDFQETFALRAIADEVEPNAAILIHTNTFFFTRYLRHDGDRVWVPVGACDHRAGIRVFGVTPYAVVHGADAWIRDPLEFSFDAGRADATLRALFDEGRPIYFSALLDFQVPFFAALQDHLSARYTLTPVPRTGRWPLFRVTPAE